MGFHHSSRIRGLAKVLALGALARKHTSWDSNAHLDHGLDRIADRLGLNLADLPGAAKHPHRMACSCYATPTADTPRTLIYAPDMDGQAAPGEVIWFKAPTTPPTTRAMVIVARAKHLVIGLLVSDDPSHASDPNWLEIGTGSWNLNGATTWVRMDTVVSVPEIDIRRQGAFLPRHRFERIAHRLQSDYGWV